jgi:hypothetical protein
VQSPAADPVKPIDPTQPPPPASATAETPNATAIPELGIAGGRTKEAAPGTPLTPDDRSTEFVAVEGGDQTTSAEALLVSAYVIMWALLLGFVFLTWRRQQKMELRVIDLERALGHAERSGSGATSSQA